MVLNFGLLSNRLSTRQSVLGAVAIIAGLGLYCLAYNAVRGQDVTVANAFSWPVINILPFFGAWEWTKTRSSELRWVSLAAACTASLLLDWAYSEEFVAAFELVRRVPAVVLVLCLYAIADWLPRRSASGKPNRCELPLLPSQIVRVTSSGNYVLLHTDKGTVIHRAPLQSVESDLEQYGFVRVHRTTLVRRDTIVKVRSSDIVLADGTSVKTGARYRELLEGA
jgi:putative flippase GtrA